MLYRERLTVPPAWWALAALFALSLLLAIGFYLGPVWGVGVAVAFLAAAAGGFATIAAVIEVDPERVRVGRDQLELGYLGDVAALDRAQTERRSGVEADARAHLVLRPYVATAVELTLTDPDDPAPYWLVSTRRPAAFAAAVRTALAVPR
ncbi:MAG: hypothetical protein JWP61_1710 [Friedmanniella sp.]|jgi:hypothetical protein|nr:hypothetical protein [Friedmanniella sp.]